MEELFGGAEINRNMDGPVHCFLAVAAALASASCVMAAEVQSNAKSERVVSPRVAALLSAASQDLVRTSAKEPITAVTEENREPPVQRAGTIVRLPSYIVRERRPPSTEEVMVKAEREKLAMQKYLGDESGLERALNMFSVAGFWAKIPVLGKYPFIVGQYSGRDAGLPVGPRTNEQRALELYEKDKLAERWAQLSGLTPTPPALLKRK